MIMPKINIEYCRDCPNYEVIKHLDCELGDDVEAYCKKTGIKFMTLNWHEWIPDWCPYKKREQNQEDILFIIPILVLLIVGISTILIKFFGA